MAAETKGFLLSFFHFCVCFLFWRKCEGEIVACMDRSSMVCGVLLFAAPVVFLRDSLFNVNLEQLPNLIPGAAT